MTMFARYFVELPLSTEQVEGFLTGDPDTWLPGLAGKATRRGDDLLAEVGFGDKIRVTRPVSITIGRPIQMGTKIVLPLAWVPAVGVGLFPTLDADLEIAPLGSDRTQLAMSARYSPPLKAVGRAIDRIVLYRVAEATLKDFLDGVAATLTFIEAAHEHA
jgi:hypothetical protein